MSEIDREHDVVDLLCITAAQGTLAVPATDVVSIRKDDAPAGDVPSVDLEAILGRGAGDAARRHIRVATAGALPFDLVTDGVIAVRTVARRALQPVPSWLAPFCAPFGVSSLLLSDERLVLLIDAAVLRPQAPDAGAPA